MDVWIHGTELRAQQEVLAFTVNGFLIMMPRQFNGEIIVLLINDIGTIEYPHTKE